MDYYTKLAELQKVREQAQNIANIVDSKEKSLAQLESKLRQNQLPLQGPQQLEYNMRNALGPMLMPGNIGDVNSVIWPFYFNTDVPDEPIAANETFQTGFSVTQEAAFIMMSFTKVVYLSSGEDPNQSWGYLDQADSQPSAPGLTFTFRDGSSSRQFFNTPMNIDLYGNPRFPTKFPRPIMFLPNQVVQIAFTNSHPVNEYVPRISVFGYRIRIEDAQRMLSLVYA
jgi:hypothetical protein